MFTFFIGAGVIGLAISGFCFFVSLDDRDMNTLYPLLAGAFFFGLVSYSLNEEGKRPPQTINQMVRAEYSRCLDSYNPETVLKEINTSREALCLESTKLYREGILGKAKSQPQKFTKIVK